MVRFEKIHSNPNLPSTWSKVRVNAGFARDQSFRVFRTTNTMCNHPPITRVVCLGDPVMDVLAHVDYEFLERIGAAPGGCFPIPQTTMEKLLQQTQELDTFTRVPGGSAANVAKALGQFLPHAEVSFSGMVGKDTTAAEYAQMLRGENVKPNLVESTSSAPTATCLCLVTPDGQRTMRTSLCAALELTSATLLPRDWCSGFQLLHCEGYTMYRPQMALEAMKAAKEKGLKVSLDLASFETESNCKETLKALYQNDVVDIVFCNQEEAAAILELAPDPPSTALSEEEMIDKVQDLLLKHVEVVVVSRGARGCIAKSRFGEVGISPACHVDVVDTVGAGDYFTGGFLTAWLQGASLQQAAVCGCVAGTAAVRSSGAKLAPEKILQVREGITQVLATN